MSFLQLVEVSLWFYTWELIVFLQFEEEREFRTDSKVRYHRDLSAKLLNDLFSYIQTQPNPFGIKSLARIQEAKELEKFGLVTLRDSDASINDSYSYNLVVIFIQVELRFYLHSSIFLCEFQGVALVVEKHLLKPKFVCANLIIVLQRYMVRSKQVYLVVLRLVLLDHNHLFYSFLHVENCGIYPKLAVVDLRDWEKVMHVEAKQLRRRLLHF